MDAATVILGIVAAGGCAVAIWLAVGRAKLMADHARERADRENAERDAAAAQSEASRLTSQVSDTRDTLTKVSIDRAGLEKELDAEKGAHAVTRNTLEKRRLDDVAAVERLSKQRIDGVLESVASERKIIQEQHAAFETKVRETFGSLSLKALKDNREEFLALAQKTFDVKSKSAEGDMAKREESLRLQAKAIVDVMERTELKLSQIEKDRLGAYSGLTEQVRAMQETSHGLRQETGKLVSALRKPEVRGRWGEIQLERVVELAGMKNYCDVSTQQSTRDEHGRLLRPDMVVRLPNGRVLAVDAKTNISAYIDAVEATNPEASQAALDRFTLHVSDQVEQLSSKNYWSQFADSPQFVVMFIPGDQFIDAAMQRDDMLIERAARVNVILASPSTLIGLLKAVAVGWREQRVHENATHLVQLGQELHQRAATFIEHIDGLGSALGGAVEKYNKAVGSFSQQLVPTLRKFEQADAKGNKDLPHLSEIEVSPRVVDAKRLLGPQ